MNPATLPSPNQLAPVPDQYSSWYPGQDQTFSRVMSWMASDQKFLCVEAPTGSGKSLLSVLSSMVSGKRAAILTATKGLQSQLLTDFYGSVTDIRGQANYSCLAGEDLGITVQEASCHAGVPCTLRHNGCLYYDQRSAASRAPITVTNYAYWLAQVNHSDGIGERDLLICDEAHLAFQALESFVSVRVGRDELEKTGCRFPQTAMDDWDQWRTWARGAWSRVSDFSDSLRTDIQDAATEGRRLEGKHTREYRRLQGLARRLESIYKSSGRWSWQGNRGSWSFVPLWPADYGHLLFGSAKKVILMSAFMTPKTADLLGIEDPPFVSAPSGFPASNTPVKHVSTVRLNFRSSDEDIKAWVSRIDQLIDRRLDRKGIVFTVSYNRRNTLLNLSRHRDIMMSHGTSDVVQMVDAFRKAPAPRVLVSPSVTSGWDFPGTDCEYIVIGKIPYPDTRPAVVKARTKEDKDWTSYVAMGDIVQEAGRGTRSASDQCEVLLVDDNWLWFWNRYKHFAPGWFHDRIAGFKMMVHGPPWGPHQSPPIDRPSNR